jgi:uncharacterized protein YbjT (DUF2867 family)
MRVAIAGATGFIGRALVENLRVDHDVVGLSRAVPRGPAHARVEWRACDLFSLLEAERGLAGADAAVYLVHSMTPSARLTQGSFEDFDLICADNFARAAERAGVRHILYVSGIVPPDAHLSRHLESRREVEQALGARKVPITTLRAGLVLGAGGSSFDIMVRLVERLPAMIGPSWTRSLTQPIALADVVRLLRHCLHDDEVRGRACDVGAPEVMTYAEMLRRTAAILGKPLRLLTIPFYTPRLSLLWVRVITGAPMELVSPLVESLRHDMVARDPEWLQERAGLVPTPFDAAMRTALADERAAKIAAGVDHPRPTKKRKRDASASRVRSVQRLPLPAGWDATRVAEEYASWLPRFLRPALHVEVDAARVCRFYVRALAKPLLEMSYAKDRSAPDRQLFYITGGLLARAHAADAPHRARLEFRVALGGRVVIAAVHDFVPSMPWFIYAVTQALVHLWVMRAFGRHLGRIDATVPKCAPA